MTSPKIVARISGSLYLFASVCFVFAMLVRSGVINASDSAEVADNIRLSAPLFRASLALEFFSGTCFLLTGMALYVLQQHVQRLAAAAMVVFAVVEVVVAYLADLNLCTALTIAVNADYAQAFGADASNSLVRLFLEARSDGVVIDEMFFGLWLVPLGYLVIKSGAVPTAGGRAADRRCGQLDRTVSCQSPGARSSVVFEIGQIGGVGEFVFVAWLLIFGVKLPAAGALVSAMATNSGRR